jgi:hypothetical protein
MIDKFRMLQAYKFSSRNQDLGQVKTFYFDDRHWTIRYLVGDTGASPSGREALISTGAVEAVSRERHRIVLGVTKQQVEQAPSLVNGQPVSPAFEEAWTPHVHRASDVFGAYVQTPDGEIGHVEDFLVDEDTWAIRYLVINTQNWGPGRRVLMAPRWIQRVAWGQWELFVAFAEETIREAPEYTDRLLVTREYEARLHEHYGRRGYWLSEPEPDVSLITPVVSGGGRRRRVRQRDHQRNEKSL